MRQIKQVQPSPIWQQKGFTLLELMVVVSVLAALAGLAAVSVESYQQHAEKQLAEVEMQRIASAIYRFKADTGYFPKEGLFTAARLYQTGSSPEKDIYEKKINLKWLFSQPVTSGAVPVLPWKPSTGRGWHGPYLEPSSQRYVIDDSITCGLEDALFSTPASSALVTGLTDPIERSSDNGVETCSTFKENGTWLKRKYGGQAYRYATAYKNDGVDSCQPSSNGCIALISAGQDSKFSGTAVGDDIVYILRVNP